MPQYSLQVLKPNSFPGNKLYEETLSDFNDIFEAQAQMREKAMTEIVNKIFKEIKKASGHDTNAFTIRCSSDYDKKVPGGRLTRCIANVQQIFDLSVFEVDYLFAKWDLEGNILAHYRQNPNKPYDKNKLFVANSVRVKIFAKGELGEVAHQVFRKHEEELERFSKGVVYQDVSA